MVLQDSCRLNAPERSIHIALIVLSPPNLAGHITFNRFHAFGERLFGNIAENDVVSG